MASTNSKGKVINHIINGVIFDLDGTLVSSSLNFVEIRDAIGCPQDQDLLEYTAGLDTPQRLEAEQTIIDFELRDAAQAVIMPGVHDMLVQLNEWQIPTAIVTRNCLEASNQKLQNCNLSFDILITRECAPAKPDPTALLEIARHWQEKPENLIYVGDYLHDINAAKNAGMRSVYMAFKAFPEWGESATWHFFDYPSFTDMIGAYRQTNSQRQTSCQQHPEQVLE